MDITSVLAVICTGVVFLAWFVLPHSKTEATRALEIPEAPALEVAVTAEPASLTA